MVEIIIAPEPTPYQEFCTTAYCPYCNHDVLEHNNESKSEKKGCRLCRAIEISPDKECGYTESQLFQEWRNQNHKYFKNKKQKID